ECGGSTSDEVGSSSRARNESASSNKRKSLIPERSESWRSSRNNRLKIWSGIATRDHSSVKDKILATSSMTSKVENALAEMPRDMDEQMEKRADDG
ncbi:hypothetical protein Tco_1373222, partial [Tanacetum coccineum]